MVKTLVLHPADDPVRGPWTKVEWDYVIDLGRATPNSYRRWSEFFRCPVAPASQLEGADFEQIRGALSSGMGLLVDEHGLDWWDLIALEFHQHLEEIARLRATARTIGAHDEVFISRSGFHAQILTSVLNRTVPSFSSNQSILHRLRHYSAVWSKFSAPQLLQIVADKYDTGYQLRRLIAPRPKASSEPVVLLPSAYVNVTRTELQYAEALPNAQFLLVATRHNGWIAKAAKNVRVAKLAAYAGRDKTQDDFKHLLARWTRLKPDLASDPILSVAIPSGVLDSFPKFLRDGLMIRDAWLQVFHQEPVSAVLCADDANLPTRIPLLLARNRGLPGLSCHHGALDGRYRFRPEQDGIFLAKGSMEREYLIKCGVPPHSIEVGAPLNVFRTKVYPDKAPWIVFFSDAYEVVGGRATEFYRELLPSLVRLASATRRKLVIKLHPAESLRDRKKLAANVLSDQELSRVSFISGPLTDELLANTAFAVTVLSTTAVECTMRGVPAFIYARLDYSNYAYADHFLKFRAGIRLDSADEIMTIPQKLADWSPPKSAELWQPMLPDRLSELLSGHQIAQVSAAS
jgi:hypothetical protein